MFVYNIETLDGKKEYNFFYTNDEYNNSILQIKIKNKICLAEVKSIREKNENDKYDDLDITQVISKNKYDKLDSNVLQFIDTNDKKLIKYFVQLNPNNFEYASKELKNDTKFIRSLLNKKGEKINKTKFEVLKYMSDNIKKDKEFAEKLIYTYRIIYILKFFHEKVYNSSQFMFKFLNYAGFYEVLGDKLKSNKEFLCKCILKNKKIILDIPVEIKENTEFVKFIISKDLECFKFFSKNIRTNKNILDIAIERECRYNVTFPKRSYSYAYVNMRPDKKINYITSLTNTYGRSTAICGIDNYVVMTKDVASEILTKNSTLDKYVINYEKFLDGNSLYECKVPSRNWKNLKKYKDKIVLQFLTKEIKGPGLRDFIQMLINKYQENIEWYAKEIMIEYILNHYADYPDYPPKFADEYTRYFYDEDGYSADEYIVGKPKFLDDAFMLDNDNVPF